MRSKPSASSVPKAAESKALTRAMVRLVVRASMISGLAKALPYQATEKPCQTMAWRPELKDRATISATGA